MYVFYSMPPPQINIAELHGMQTQKKQIRTQSFDHIITLCHRRIRTVASHYGQNTFYEIPSVVFGFPLYDHKECIEYVITALRRNGFLVQILPAPHFGVIYISWDPRELNPPKPAAAIEAPLPMPMRSLPNPSAPSRSRLRIF